MLIGPGLVGLGIAIIAYYGWRLWLRLRGVPYKPEGHWESRLTASYRYAETQPKLTRRQRVQTAVTVVAVVILESAIVAFLYFRSN